MRAYYFNVLKYKLYTKFSSNIDLFLAVSNFIKQKGIEGGLSPIETLYLGITLPKYSKIKKGHNLLFVGRLAQSKGVDIAIQSMKIIINKFPDATLTIVGEGDEYGHLKEIVQKFKLEKNIKFVGHHKINDVYTFYKESQIVLVPSVWEEPFGLVGVEALSIGRPVIASNIGGIPEWLEDGKSGYLVKPNNPNQIAKYVIKLLSDDNLLQTMSCNAHNSVKKFSIKKHINLLENKYQEIINNFNKRK
jgi:glycosyltransferase involved in cell wall biosynthesis